jgi:hypothetical protein
MLAKSSVDAFIAVTGDAAAHQMPGDRGTIPITLRVAYGLLICQRPREHIHAANETKKRLLPVDCSSVA